MKSDNYKFQNEKIREVKEVLDCISMNLFSAPIVGVVTGSTSGIESSIGHILISHMISWNFNINSRISNISLRNIGALILRKRSRGSRRACPLM